MVSLDMEITISTSKEDIEKLSKDCKKCGHCCSYGTGYLIKGDLEAIADYLKKDLKTLKEEKFTEAMVFGTPLLRPKTLTEDDGKPFGKCVFLKDNNCMIHPVKPYMCKVGTCSKSGASVMEWFYLHYAVQPYNNKSLSEWNARLESHPTIQGGAAEDLVPDKQVREKLLSMNDCEEKR